MRTGALIRPITIKTSSSIEARLGITLIDIKLAIASSESSETQASEGIDSIHTSTTVEARATVVQKKRFFFQTCF